MKERGILFNAEMVRAVLAGRKTQTRRVVKPQPPTGWDRHCCFDASVYGWTHEPAPAELWHEVRCPYGQPGDRLWVRESFLRGRDPVTDTVATKYAADYSPGSLGSWKPSIHMPRWASRITLEVTGVRVERVQDISVGDCLAEGVNPTYRPGHDIDIDGCLWPEGERKVLREFREIWDSISAARGFGWSENPWVWVVEFRRVEA